MTASIQPKRAFATLSRLKDLALRATYIEQQNNIGRLIVPSTAEQNMMIALTFARVATAGVLAYGAILGASALYKSAVTHMQPATQKQTQPVTDCNVPFTTPQGGWTTMPKQCAPK